VRQAAPIDAKESKAPRWGSLPHPFFLWAALFVLAVAGLILYLAGIFKYPVTAVASAGLPTADIIRASQDSGAGALTQTLIPTVTLPALPSLTPTTEFPTLEPTRETVRAHLSYYWPPFGDMNCFHDCLHVANGDAWQKWVDIGLACPSIYPLGTVFMIMGEEWTCVDRGEAITVDKDSTIWLDLLVSRMPYGLAWGSVRSVEVRRLK
jgi:hypothetical protein